MRKVTALSVRQRRRLARLEQSLAGDAVLTELLGLFAVPRGPARSAGWRPTPRLRMFLWSGLAVLAGVVAAAVGAVVTGPAAAVAVFAGAMAITGGLAFLLTAATAEDRTRGRVRRSLR